MVSRLVLRRGSLVAMTGAVITTVIDFKVVKRLTKVGMRTRWTPKRLKNGECLPVRLIIDPLRFHSRGSYTSRPVRMSLQKVKVATRRGRVAGRHGGNRFLIHRRIAMRYLNGSDDVILGRATALVIGGAQIRIC